MSDSISQRELRNDSGAIMRRVVNGERFIVTRNGIPVADLVPHESSSTRAPRRFVPVAELANVVSLPSWGVDQYRRELNELDDRIDDRDVDRWAGGR